MNFLFRGTLSLYCHPHVNFFYKHANMSVNRDPMSFVIRPTKNECFFLRRGPYGTNNSAPICDGIGGLLCGPTYFQISRGVAFFIQIFCVTRQYVNSVIYTVNGSYIRNDLSLFTNLSNIRFVRSIWRQNGLTFSISNIRVIVSNGMTCSLTKRVSFHMLANRSVISSRAKWILYSGTISFPIFSIVGRPLRA